jgi:hypothetical protein
MDFYALLAQVVDLLRSRGWVSYRALQRHSELDDAYLDDLKVELIDTQPLTRDENSSILVWLGGAETAPSPPSSSSPPAPHPAMQEVVTALFFAAQVHGLRREWQRTYKQAEAALGRARARVCLPGGAGHATAGLGAGRAGTGGGRAHADMPGTGRTPCHRVRDRGVSCLAGRDIWEGGTERKGCGWPRRRSLSAAQGQSCISSRASCC